MLFLFLHFLLVGVSEASEIFSEKIVYNSLFMFAIRYAFGWNRRMKAMLRLCFCWNLLPPRRSRDHHWWTMALWYGNESRVCLFTCER